MEKYIENSFINRLTDGYSFISSQEFCDIQPEKNSI